MTAIVISEPGPPEVLRPMQRPVPELKAGEVFFVEAVVDIFPEVTLESAWRQIELDGGGFGNFADAFDAVLFRRLKIGDNFRRDYVAASRPDCEDARLAGHLAPLIGDIVDKHGFVAGDGHVFHVALAACTVRWNL